MGVFHDFRVAARGMRRHATVFLAAAMLIGVAIGANATVFIWIKAILLEPLPGVSAPGEIVVVAERSGGSWIPLSYPKFRDYRTATGTVRDVFAEHPLPVAVSQAQTVGRAQREWGALVSGNYFRALRVRAAAGRLLTEADDQVQEGHPVAVISDSLWRREFNRSPTAIGGSVLLNGRAFTIIGVADAAFRGSLVGLALDVWAPLMMQPALVPGGARFEQRETRWLQVMARVDGGSVVAAQQTLGAIASRAAVSYPADERQEMVVLPFWRSPAGAQYEVGPALLALAGFVVLVLCLACSNVAGLLLNLAVARQRDTAVKVAVGAGWRHLARGVAVECLLLSVAGGAVGLLIAGLLSRSLLAMVPPTDLPIQLDLRLDFTVVGAVAGLVVLSSFLCGLLPIVPLFRIGANAALREGGGLSPSSSGSRLRQGLVALQVGMTVIILASAALFYNGFNATQRADPGFDPRNVLLASYNLVESGYDAETGGVFNDRLLDRLSALPFVESVSLARWMPLGLERVRPIAVRLDSAAAANEPQLILLNVVSRDYFRTMRILLRTGREFRAEDNAQAPPVAIVNDVLERRYWPEGAVGHTVTYAGRAYRVIGVSANVRYTSAGETPSPFIYVPLSQDYRPSVVLQMRTKGDPTVAAATMREVIGTLAPSLPLYEVKTLQQHLEFSRIGLRVASTLLSALGALALLVAVVGIYSVVAFTIEQRKREYGVRLALGDTPTGIALLIVRFTTAMMAIGTSLGIAGMAWVGAAISSAGLLPSTADPGIVMPTFLATAALMASGLLAIAVPAVRMIRHPLHDLLRPS